MQEKCKHSLTSFTPQKMYFPAIFADSSFEVSLIYFPRTTSSLLAASSSSSSSYSSSSFSSPLLPVPARTSEIWGGGGGRRIVILRRILPVLFLSASAYLRVRSRITANGEQAKAITDTKQLEGRRRKAIQVVNLHRGRFTQGLRRTSDEGKDSWG